MILKRSLFLICIILAFLLPSGVLSSNDSVVLNIMIDAELYPPAVNMTSDEKIEMEIESLERMLDVIDPKGLNVTVYFTSDYVSERAGNTSYMPYASQVGAKPNHELAIHGKTTAELLGSMPYNEQYSILTESKRLIEESSILDDETLEVKGFRPQYFSQNDTTYEILDEMGIIYNSGYKAGLLYLPGHEDDTWPYIVENHTFYAVPISTHDLSGEIVYLCDLSTLYTLKLSGTQWYDFLVSEFEECSENGDPMVVIFHNFVSGWDDEYLEAFGDFIDYAASKDATFVTTLELVEIVKQDEKVA
jgi:peptidoglycan/xylan/chitin deacetylase (PgdA/CDA1 family)